MVRKKTCQQVEKWKAQTVPTWARKIKLIPQDRRTAPQIINWKKKKSQNTKRFRNSLRRTLSNFLLIKDVESYWALKNKEQ